MFKLNPDPTFWRTVTLSLPNGQAAELELEYRYRTRPEFAEFAKNVSGREDFDVISDIVVGWRGVDAEFSADNLRALVNNYHQASREIAEDYSSALTEARRKN